jgi:hypothetical protein
MIDNYKRPANDMSTSGAPPEATTKNRDVTDEMALRQVAVDYLRHAAERALTSIRRSHLTMAEPCDINSIASSLAYAVDNVIQVLAMVPQPTEEQIDDAWGRFNLNSQRITELEDKVIHQEI